MFFSPEDSRALPFSLLCLYGLQRRLKVFKLVQHNVLWIKTNSLNVKLPCSINIFNTSKTHYHAFTEFPYCLEPLYFQSKYILLFNQYNFLDTQYLVWFHIITYYLLLLFKSSTRTGRSLINFVLVSLKGTLY